MVRSAMGVLATVMVLTLTGPERLEARGLLPQPRLNDSGISLDALMLPWDSAQEAVSVNPGAPR